MEKKDKGKSEAKSRQATKEPQQPTWWGQWLRAAREALGITRKNVHHLTGIPERTLGNWERGEREPGATAWLVVYGALLSQAEKRGMSIPPLFPDPDDIPLSVEDVMRSATIDKGKQEESSGFGLRLANFPNGYHCFFICDHCHALSSCMLTPETSEVAGCDCKESQQKGQSISIALLIPIGFRFAAGEEISFDLKFVPKRQRKPKAK